MYIFGESVDTMYAKVMKVTNRFVAAGIVGATAIEQNLGIETLSTLDGTGAAAVGLVAFGSAAYLVYDAIDYLMD